LAGGFFNLTEKVGTPRVDLPYGRLEAPGTSSPHPRKRRSSGVSLLPSGPGPFPPANMADSPSGQPGHNRRPSGTRTLRCLEPLPPAWQASPRLRPPRIGGFGLQGTPNPPA